MFDVLEGMSRVLKVDQADLMLQTEGIIVLKCVCTVYIRNTW